MLIHDAWSNSRDGNDCYINSEYLKVEVFGEIRFLHCVEVTSSWSPQPLSITMIDVEMLPDDCPLHFRTVSV